MSDCIESKHKMTTGYGTIKRDGKTWLRHRWEWTQHNGPIPEGMVIGHRCNNKLCYNIDHLYLCTHQQNCKDAYRDGLYYRPKGEEHHSSKLKESDVIDILSSKETGVAMAEKYGVSKRLIYYIRHRKLWTHVPFPSLSEHL